MSHKSVDGVGMFAQRREKGHVTAIYSGDYHAGRSQSIPRDPTAINMTPPSPLLQCIQTSAILKAQTSSAPSLLQKFSCNKNQRRSLHTMADN